MRGQIVLLASDPPLLTHVINEGPRYLVPRADGRLLIGSTEEEAGFDRATTTAGVQGLLEFAKSLVPAVSEARFERAWAGLRPASLDGRPYIGRVPRIENAILAAGHFRSGLQLSPATAVAIASLILEREPPVDLSAFAPDRQQAASLQWPDPELCADR